MKLGPFRHLARQDELSLRGLECFMVIITFLKQETLQPPPVYSIAGNL